MPFQGLISLHPKQELKKKSLESAHKALHDVNGP